MLSFNCKTSGHVKDSEAARGQLLVSLQQSLSNKGVTVSIDPASGILRLPEDLLFRTGDAAIGRENLPRLQTLAAVLASTLPCYVHGGDTSGCNVIAPILETVLVEGHTDRQAYKNTVLPAALSAPTSGSLLLSRRRRHRRPPKSLSPKNSELRNDRLSTDRALNVFKEQAKPNHPWIHYEIPISSRCWVFGVWAAPSAARCSGIVAGGVPKNRRIDLRFVLSARTSDELMRLRNKSNERWATANDSFLAGA